jgi:[ribosomal protein S5]-alanine N-acetyltransferase
MPTRAPSSRSSPRDARRVLLRPPRRSDADAFLHAVKASRPLHGAWVVPPSTREGFTSYVKRFGAVPEARRESRTHAGFVVVERESGALAGVFNVSEIVRGIFQSAYVGYYAFAGFEGRGLMREGFALVLAEIFGPLHLHRIEANVQPRNARSIALVTALGFRHEGIARRYLKIGGRWRDHARYALLAEEWRQRRGRT